MNQNLKLIVVAIVCFAIGGVSFYGWSEFTQTKKINQELAQQLEDAKKIDSSEKPLDNLDENEGSFC